MQKSERVEEVVEEVAPKEVSPPVDETTEPEVDPAEALELVLQKRAEVQEREAAVAAERERVAQEEQALRHSLAVGLVDGLFLQLAEFASEFTSGVIFQRYAELQRHCEKVREHDSSFPKSLSEAKYDLNSEDFNFWLNHLEKHIAAGVPLDKFLTAVFQKVHGSPFQVS